VTVILETQGKKKKKKKKWFTFVMVELRKLVFCTKIVGHHAKELTLKCNV
jgi:hypothetical protein